MKLYALPHQDGSVSIMQLFADHPVQKEIAKARWHSPVLIDDVREITRQEADAIRSARRKET